MLRLKPAIHAARMRHRSAGRDELLPVFYDETGNRYKIYRDLVIVAAAVLAMLQCIVIYYYPQPVNPPQSCDQSLQWAQEELSHQPTPLPTIGIGILTRVDEVQRRGDQLILADPCTHEEIRPIGPDEVPAGIEHSDYVTEHYGNMPDKTVAITFDDGPNPDWTPQILDVLKRNGVHATFFMIGQQIPGNEALVQRVIAEGNLIGNHTENHHADWAPLDANAARAELSDADRAIRAASGYTTRLTRAPDGDPDSKTRELLTGQQLGYVHVNFDIDTLDWAKPDQAIQPPPLDGAGHVILMHDGGGDRSSTVKLLQAIIDEGKAQGYTFTTIAPLLTPGQMPQSHVTPSLVDAWSLFWKDAAAIARSSISLYGLISLAGLSGLFLILAWANYLRQYLRRQDRPAYTRPVTVVITVHNEKENIWNTLQSILFDNDAYPNLRVIVIDDGSTDGTSAMLQEFAKRNFRLRVIRQHNQGKTAALNKAVNLVTTEVVVFTDGDCALLPGFVWHIVQPFADHKVGAVAGCVQSGNRRGVIGWYQSYVYATMLAFYRNAVAMLQGITIVPGAAGAFRVAALRAAGGFSERTRAEDCDMTMSIRQLGYTIRQCNLAVSRTDTPTSWRALFRQWLRWGLGNQQAAWAHASMMFNPFRYGLVSLVMLNEQLAFWAGYVLRFVVSGIAVVAFLDGNWRGIVLFAILVAAIDILKAFTAIVMLREHWMHLVIAPFIRPINELVQLCVQTAVIFYIIKGSGRPFESWLSAGARSGKVQRAAVDTEPVSSSLLVGTPR